MNKQEIIKYLKENKFDIQSANATFLALTSVYSAYANCEKVSGVNFSPIIAYTSFKKNAARGFASFVQIIPNKLIEEIGVKSYTDYIKNPKSLDKKRKDHKKLELELDKLWNTYLKKREGILEKELLKIYKKMVDLLTEWWYYGAIEEGKGRSIEQGPVLSWAKRNKISIKDASEIISVLSHPKEPSIFTNERTEFFKNCLYVFNKRTGLEGYPINKLLKDKKLNQKLGNYIKKYFWFKSDFYKIKKITKNSLLQDILKEIKGRSKNDILFEIQKGKDDLEKIEKQKKELLAGIKINKEDKRDIDFATKIIFWIDERKEGMMKIFYYLNSFLEDIAAKNNLNYHHLGLYGTKELEKFIESKKKISAEEAKSRDEGVFIIWEKGKDAKIFYNKDAEELFSVATHIKEEELTGQVASRGSVNKITGRIKIILNPKKEKFEDGCILVTSMTRVEFVPLMKKAKAIITNEGGIACHAAIVSRELGIPCIIGTKNATRVLKDGDMVEMDLEKGTIKILNKK